jgi:hypothetical protein
MNSECLCWLTGYLYPMMFGFSLFEQFKVSFFATLTDLVSLMFLTSLSLSLSLSTCIHIYTNNTANAYPNAPATVAFEILYLMLQPLHFR